MRVALSCLGGRVQFTSMRSTWTRMRTDYTIYKLFEFFSRATIFLTAFKIKIFELRISFFAFPVLWWFNSVFFVIHDVLIFASLNSQILWYNWTRAILTSSAISIVLVTTSQYQFVLSIDITKNLTLNLTKKMCRNKNSSFLKFGSMFTVHWLIQRTFGNFQKWISFFFSKKWREWNKIEQNKIELLLIPTSNSLYIWIHVI